MPILSNSRHELFAQELAKGATADEAYQLAGYKANRGNASTLKANQIVADRVAEILAAGAERAEITVHDIAAQLDEDRAFAREKVAPAAAIQATMGKAKVLGLLVERMEHTGKDGGPIETVKSDREVAKDIAFVLARGAKAQPSMN